MNREIKLTLIRDMGISIQGDGRKYRMGLFRCPICGNDKVKIMKDGMKGKFCSHKCRGLAKGRIGPYNKDGLVMISGYKYKYNPDHPQAIKSGYVAEHRLIAESPIGRPLRADEDVHHVNEIKTDNRPENLMVLTKSEHSKLHRSKTNRDEHGKFKI